MSSLREKLIESYKNGLLLLAINAATEDEDRDKVSAELSILHNEGLIDVVEAFSALQHNTFGGGAFFQIRRVFEDALPNIESPVLPVMKCVQHLCRAAGNDMAAGTIFNGFIDFCEKDSARPTEVLRIAEDNPDEYADFVSLAIIAGARTDTPKYLSEALKLTKNDNIEVRRRVLFVLGRIPNLNSKMTDMILSELEKSVSTENDDQLLGSIIKSAFSCVQQDNTRLPRVLMVIDIALSRGDEIALHAASELFGLNFNKLQEDLLDVLLKYLKKVKSNNVGTLNNIDYGIDHLLKRSDPKKGISILEELLLENSNNIPLKVFDSASRTIASNMPLLCTLVTRWLLRGDKVLCEGLRGIFTNFHNKEPLITIDVLQLKPNDHIHIVFLARKAIGYLFLSPVSVASIIVSLMQLSTAEETVPALTNLLIDPILLNHPNVCDDFLVKKSSQEQGNIKEVLDKIKVAIDSYLKDIHSVGEHAELNPSEDHQEAHLRHFSRLMASSMKEAQKNSV